MTLWWKRNFYNQHNHLKIGKTYPEAFKTDGTPPIALGNWTKNILIHRRLQRVDVYVSFTKRASV